MDSLETLVVLRKVVLNVVIGIAGELKVLENTIAHIVILVGEVRRMEEEKIMAENWTVETLAEQMAANPDFAKANVTALPERKPERMVGSMIPPPKRGKPSDFDVSKLKVQTSKYKAQRTSYNGKVYPSKKQAKKAEELELLKSVGKIKGYIEEVPFRLPGKSVHRVDFGVIELDNKVTWLETKGRDLPMGKLKRRQVEELFHIHIVVE